MSLSEISEQIKCHRTRYVTITGGEPLAQKNCLVLLQQLCDQGYSVSLETSGALDISEVDQRVNKVIDLKTPGSLEEEKNNYENLKFINRDDEIKFVICDRGDYDWAKNVMDMYQLAEKCGILFSPVAGDLEAVDLANWILGDNLPVRFQIQLHKLLWDDEPGR